ncbi:sulfatase-like hydrolase/transferase [uncultured Robinsoniella sp.]|uniref:sulfatase-like hydrolase/transferase n=1 Tax=uncultured Robinsoniella sp. TaxID=904190 RepID=UPI00374F5CBF
MKHKKVILIMTDTQRTDMLGCYGNSAMHTPNLDSLAAEGVLFEKAYTTQPVCQPARSAIFTGSYPHSCAGWSNCMGLSDNVQNIGKRLTDQGIHSAYIGKWHLDGGDYFGLGVCPDGWDEAYWYDMRCYLEELTEEERYLSRQVESIEKYNIKEEFTYGHRCSDRAIDFLKNHQDEDYFLVVSYDEPHGPHLCPKKYTDLYQDYEIPKKKNMSDTLENKPAHHRIWAGDDYGKAAKEDFHLCPKEFLGCNTFVDFEIGRVLDAVKEFADDSVIIYTSDHGDMMYSHSLTGKGPAMYEEITHIPLLIKGFGKGKNHNPVSHINLAPTIFDILGVSKTKMFEGNSILPELTDKSTRVNDYIFMEFGRYEVDHDGFGGYQPVRAAFDGRYKLVINLMDTDEFYDLELDPEEMNNEIHNPEYDKEKKRLHKALLDQMYETRDPFRGYYWENRHWNPDTTYQTWDSRKMTRQRENEEYEPRQLDYGTGLPIREAVRVKGESDAKFAD